MNSLIRVLERAPQLRPVQMRVNARGRAAGSVAMASIYESGHSARGPREVGSSEPSPAMLARLIEGEIIPRLLMAHRGDAVIAARKATAIDISEVEAFAPMVLAADVPVLLVYVESVLARGVPLDSVYVDLLGAAARELGEWWERDACDFIDVTMGLWRLQQVVHELATRLPPPPHGSSVQRRGFFTVAPGSQHSFGLVLIEEFFRRAGWQTWSAVAPSAGQLVAMVERQWFELVGFTVSRVEDLDPLPALIQSLRAASLNPAIGVMVGGGVFNASPELAAAVGADATASDGRQAVAVAEAVLADCAGRALAAGSPG